MSPFVIAFLVFVAFTFVRPIIQRLLANEESSSGTSFSVARPRQEQQAQATAVWNETAAALGLRATVRRGQPLYMRGTVDGMRVSLAHKSNGIEVEAEYETGIANFDIRPVNSSAKFWNIERIHTGEPAFDAALQVHGHDVAATTNFLTPLRREALLALHSAVEIDEIDEDELEVLLPKECTTNEIVEGVQLVVQVAKILDATQPVEPSPTAPQDAVIAHHDSYPQDSYPQDAVR